MTRRRLRRVLVGLLTVAGFAVAVWALGWSQLLGVRQVEVVGEHRATQGLIVLTAEIEKGTPLARVDTGAVAARVRSLPVVESATVRRVWPHTLRVTVVERRPVAVVRDGDGLRLIDRYGVDFAEAQSQPPGLPLLDLDLTTAGPAEVTAAAAVVDVLPSPLRRRVVALEAHSPDDVRLRLRSGAVVWWGDDSQGEQKAAVLQALLKHRAERYDVRAPMAPTTAG